MNIKDFDIDERVQQAVQNFESGFNCAQSVFLAYSDVFDLNIEVAKRMSVSFGGGVGRMREICGAVSGMAMLVGFRYPVLDPQDQEARTRNYAMVQKVSDIFKDKHQTIICRELIPGTETSSASTPSVQDSVHPKGRPCWRFVEDAARIAGRMLKGELEA